MKAMRRTQLAEGARGVRGLVLIFTSASDTRFISLLYARAHIYIYIYIYSALAFITGRDE